MNADEDLVVLGNRLWDVLDLYDLWRSVSVVNGGFHAALPYSCQLLLSDQCLS